LTGWPPEAATDGSAAADGSPDAYAGVLSMTEQELAQRRGRNLRAATIAGTRFRVGMLADFLLDGSTIDEVITEYPWLGSLNDLGAWRPPRVDFASGSPTRPMVRFDEELGRSVEKCFEQAGFDVDSVGDFEPGVTSSADVIEKARADDCVVVSLDTWLFVDAVRHGHDLGAGLAIVSLNPDDDPGAALDSGYELSLAELQERRRQVADVATARKHASMRIDEIERVLSGDRVAEDRTRVFKAELLDRRDELAGLEADEAEAVREVQVMKAEADAFRTSKEILKAHLTAARVISAVEALVGSIDPAGTSATEAGADVGHRAEASTSGVAGEDPTAMREDEVYVALSRIWGRRRRNLARALFLLIGALSSHDIEGRLWFVDLHGISEYQP
jgi:hypothetical protein